MKEQAKPTCEELEKAYNELLKHCQTQVDRVTQLEQAIYDHRLISYDDDWANAEIDYPDNLLYEALEHNYFEVIAKWNDMLRARQQGFSEG
jgi:hypothetical protein